MYAPTLASDVVQLPEVQVLNGELDLTLLLDATQREQMVFLRT